MTDGPPWRKLDAALVAEAINFAQAGVVNDDIAAALGIHVASFYRWAAAGRKESEARTRGAEPDPRNDLVCELYEGVRRSRARLSMRMNLRMVEAADRGEWRAAHAWLSRQPAYQADATGAIVGGDSIDAVADLSESAVTAVQARQVAMAMTALLAAAVALVRAKGADEAADALEAAGRDLASEALLGVPADRPSLDPPSSDS